MDQLTFDSPDRPTAPLWSAGPRRRSSRLYEAEGRLVEVVEARRAQPPTMHGHHLPLCKASLCVPLMQQHAPRALLGLCSARGRRCPQRCSPNFGRAAYAPHIDVCTRRCDPGSNPGRAEPPRSQASVGDALGFWLQKRAAVESTSCNSAEPIAAAAQQQQQQRQRVEPTPAAAPPPATRDVSPRWMRVRTIIACRRCGGGPQEPAPGVPRGRPCWCHTRGEQPSFYERKVSGPRGHETSWR